MTSHPTDEIVNRYRCGPVGVTVQDVGVGRIQFNQVSNATRSVGIGKARSSALTAITNPLSWPTLTDSIVLALGSWLLAIGVVFTAAVCGLPLCVCSHLVLWLPLQVQRAIEFILQRVCILVAPDVDEVKAPLLKPVCCGCVAYEVGMVRLVLASIIIAWERHQHLVPRRMF